MSTQVRMLARHVQTSDSSTDFMFPFKSEKQNIDRRSEKLTKTNYTTGDQLDNLHIFKKLVRICNNFKI